jgi:uncharacterized repeat protein (TIGR02543 family)
VVHRSVSTDVWRVLRGVLDSSNRDSLVDGEAAPTAPAAPDETGWIFDGWYSDPARTVPFDFGASMTVDATAYAGWTDLLDVLDALEIVPSDTSPDQGDTITVAVTAFDADGHPLGDVTDLVSLESSVGSDVITGNAITFVHASPHVITARLGTVSASVSVAVQPTASGTGGTGAGPTGLALSGTDVAVPAALALAALLAAAGAALVVARRRLRRGRRA